jgi:hypothetical protein
VSTESGAISDAILWCLRARVRGQGGDRSVERAGRTKRRSRAGEAATSRGLDRNMGGASRGTAPHYQAYLRTVKISGNSMPGPVLIRPGGCGPVRAVATATLRCNVVGLLGRHETCRARKGGPCGWKNLRPATEPPFRRVVYPLALIVIQNVETPEGRSGGNSHLNESIVVRVGRAPVAHV